MFVNNCIGYRNHKWFLLLLVSFTMYMCGLVVSRVLASVVIAKLIKDSSYEVSVNIVRISLDIYLLLVVIMHSPIVFKQLSS